MSKIIKKSDITTLAEATMREAGILGENEEMSEDPRFEQENLDEDCMEEGCGDTSDTEIIEDGEEDVVVESVNRLANNASEHNIISENLKKDLASFNKIINYKY
jgi:hypothetical protein